MDALHGTRGMHSSMSESYLLMHADVVRTQERRGVSLSCREEHPWPPTLSCTTPRIRVAPRLL